MWIGNSNGCIEVLEMTVENITRRYNFTYAELEEKLPIVGKIERVSQVGQYEKDQDPELKEMDVVITTVQQIKPEDDKKSK